MKQVQGQTLDIVKNYTEYKGCTFCFPEMYLQEDMLVDITVNMWYEEKAVYCPTGSVFDNCSFRDDIDIFPCSSRFTNCNFSRRLHLYLEFCEKEKYGSSGLEEFVTDLTITNDETCGKPWRTTPTNILTHFPKIKLQRFPLLTTFNMTHHHLRSLPNEPFARGVETINFSHNNIEEEYVEILTEPPIPVKNFNFAHNQITSLYGISVLSSLEKLNAAYNQISALPEEIKTLTNLTSLNLAKNNLSNLANIIDHLAPLKNLRELCIKGNPLSDEDISSLQKELPHVSVKDYL